MGQLNRLQLGNPNESCVSLLPNTKLLSFLQIDDSFRNVFREFRSLMRERKLVEENPYLQTFQVLSRTEVKVPKACLSKDIESPTLEGERGRGVRKRKFLCFLSKESY